MTMSVRLPAVYRLVALDSVDSTNEEAKRLAARGEEEAPDGTLVWAQTQTFGRGRRGRHWVSPPGNLYCSLVLRPEVPAARGAELGFVAALAIYDAIASVAPPGLQVLTKWPNDVLVHDRKVAGILLESESANDGMPAWIVLGVGINVATYPEKTEIPATSLTAEGCKDVSASTMLEGFARHFLVWAGRWCDDGFRPILEAYRWRLKGLNEPVSVRLERETISGIFDSLDADGAMVVRFEPASGTRRITAGDVFFPVRK